MTYLKRLAEIRWDPSCGERSGLLRGQCLTVDFSRALQVTSCNCGRSRSALYRLGQRQFSHPNTSLTSLTLWIDWCPSRLRALPSKGSPHSEKDSNKLVHGHLEVMLKYNCFCITRTAFVERRALIISDVAKKVAFCVRDFSGLCLFLYPLEDDMASAIGLGGCLSRNPTKLSLHLRSLGTIWLPELKSI